MMFEWVHPGLLLILGAWVVFFLKGRARNLAILLLPVGALASCLSMSLGTYGKVRFLGLDLVFGRVDQLSLVFSYVFSIMAVIGVVYALHVKNTSQHVASLTYVGGALGVTFAGDVVSLLVFGELMALSSVLLVWQRH